MNVDQTEIMRMPFKYAYFRGKSLKQLHECKTTEGFAKGYVIQELAKLRIDGRTRHVVNPGSNQDACYICLTLWFGVCQTMKCFCYTF